MSALVQHIQDQQCAMARLCDLLEILETCVLDGRALNSHPTLVLLAKEIALEVNRKLDSVNLPQIGGEA